MSQTDVERPDSGAGVSASEALLVEQQHHRVGEQRPGQHHLLLVAAAHGRGGHVEGAGLDLEPAGPRRGGPVLHR
jgi:hypothetical protein